MSNVQTRSLSFQLHPSSQKFKHSFGRTLDLHYNNIQLQMLLILLIVMIVIENVLNCFHYSWFFKRIWNEHLERFYVWSLAYWKKSYVTFCDDILKFFQNVDTSSFKLTEKKKIFYRWILV